jgi:hypothetical protein
MDSRIIAALGILGGVMAGGITTLLGEMALHSMQLAPNVMEAEVGQAAAPSPATAWVFLLGVYAIAAFVAGYVANLICKSTKYRPALIAGVGLCIAGIINMYELGGHPTWFWVASIAVYLIGARLGGKGIPSTSH